MLRKCTVTKRTRDIRDKIQSHRSSYNSGHLSHQRICLTLELFRPETAVSPTKMIAEF
jgi:hypothetical protein